MLKFPLKNTIIITLKLIVMLLLLSISVKFFKIKYFPVEFGPTIPKRTHRRLQNYLLKNIKFVYSVQAPRTCIKVEPNNTEKKKKTEIIVI